MSASSVSLFSGVGEYLLNGMRSAKWIIVPPALHVALPMYASINPFGFKGSVEQCAS